jgi:hypothetical protein
VKFTVCPEQVELLATELLMVAVGVTVGKTVIVVPVLVAEVGLKQPVVPVTRSETVVFD